MLDDYFDDYFFLLCDEWLLQPVILQNNLIKCEWWRCVIFDSPSNCLITALFSDKEIIDLQSKLYREWAKLKAWLMRKYMKPLVCWSRNMICFMCSLPYLITSKKDMWSKCFVVGCSLLLVMMLKLCICAVIGILNL